MKWTLALFTAISLASLTSVVAQNQRDTAVREDRQSFSENESWFYDDLDTAIKEAQESRRPLMIVFR
tara:strand:+ start:351 stop:551 length:201 start_codon:yes stop_codon:yes gene_type:complete